MSRSFYTQYFCWDTECGQTRSRYCTLTRLHYQKLSNKQALNMTFTFYCSGVGLRSQDVRSRDTPRGELLCAYGGFCVCLCAFFKVWFLVPDSPRPRDRQRREERDTGKNWGFLTAVSSSCSVFRANQQMSACSHAKLRVTWISA